MAQAKRPKFDYKKKMNFYNKKSTKNFMEVGQRGFLVTCNFREKDCLRECYNLFNQYADQSCDNDVVDEDNNKHKSDNSDEEIDISTQLSAEVEKNRAEAKQKNRKFQQVITDVPNCIFIKAKVSDPMDLGLKIFRDINETKKQKSRFIMRVIPIQVICKANIKDILDASGILCDKYLLKTPKTFSIVFNKRYNNDLSRDLVIKEVAEMIATKNVDNKVDLKNAELSVIIEIIKGLACISFAPDYMKLKKFNLAELCGRGHNRDETKKVEEPTEAKKEEKIEETTAVDPETVSNNE